MPKTRQVTAMRGKRLRAVFDLKAVRIAGIVAVVLLVTAAASIVQSTPANALPSYARQTGQPCGSCHTDFAGLTPFGRRFKIGGYTMGGGNYRSTIFPTDDPATNAKPYVPPVATMAIVGFTNTATPTGAPPYNPNNNIVVSPISFFYGGAITDHIGTFAQVTYNAPNGWNWDNTDVRYADTVHIGRFDVVYGLTANNNPTVQDPWNTTPAWGFPYAQSTLMNPLGGSTHPMIMGALAQQVISGGAYAMFDDFVYLEASVYHTLDPNSLASLGITPSLGQFGTAPYWRAAIEPHWGPHYLELGTFGMTATVHPYLNGTTTVDTNSDKYTDFGFDTQYQFQGPNFWLTLRGTYVHEFQQLGSTFNLVPPGSTNPANTLDEARAYASLAYGNKNRVVLTGQYFNTWGSSDPTLYSTLASTYSPNSAGYIAEIAYIPFIDSQAPGWPWFNLRLGLQYVGYTKYDGTNVGASANNALYLYAWIAM
jgi:hypothetical protein